jgi:O-antigen/teichoic acid export membrane protein
VVATVLPHLRKLAAQSAVYGSADVLASLVNFALIPVYTDYLEPADYGDLALLALFGAMAKIVFRLGLDAGFFRIHYELERPEERRRLAGTVTLFAAGTGALMVGAVALVSGPLTRVLLGGGRPASWLVLVAADVFLSGLAFVPAALLRIEERAGLFSAASVLRHLANTALKVALLASGQGIAGVVWSDALSSAAYAAALLPVLKGRASAAFAPALLREALGFGLPKVPHGLMVQVQNLADRKILDLFVTRAELGLYQMGYSFGTLVKFPLSAFEPAWQPFVYARLPEKDAPATLARVARYAFAAFVAVGLAVAVLGPELLVRMTPASFHPAAAVIPVVALAYVLHGAFLLTSVGIGIRKQTRHYPRITALAAAANLLANLALVPRYGILGAAWATVISYAAMAAAGFLLARRLYPLPLEWPRVAQAAALAAGVYLATLFAPDATWGALAVKGALLAGYPAALAAAGFLREGPGYSETTSSGRTT